MTILEQKKEVFIELYKRKIFEPFVTDVDGRFNQKQFEALNILNDPSVRQFAFGGAAGGSKSWTGCVWLMMSALAYPNTRYFIGREELKRLRESTLMTFFKVANHYGVKRDIDFNYNGQDHFIGFTNGSRIDLLELAYKPSDPMYERYGSTEYTCGWVEEAGEVNFGAYDTLKSRVGRQLNQKYGITPCIFVTLNPKKNWTHKFFWRPYKENRLPVGVKFLPSLATDNPFLDEGYMQQLNEITDKTKRERLLLGNFDYDDDELSLISYDAIEDIFTNTHVQQQGANALGGATVSRKCITVDLARQGGDRIVMVSWNGYVGSVKAWSKEYLNKTSEFIEAERISMGIGKSDVLVDQDGIGGGVVDFMGYRGFVNGGSPMPDPVNPTRDARTGAVMPENYENAKSQCSFRMAKRINDKGIMLVVPGEQEKELIKEELAQVKKKAADQDGKLAVMKKDKVKELLGRSPDFWDAIMMREWFELMPTRRVVVA